jgi:integration host factor subunit beta
MKPKAMLTRAELSHSVVAVTGSTLIQSEQIVDTIIDSMTRALLRGDKIEIRSFGCFRIHERGPRPGRNPRTGEPVDVPARKLVRFKPGREIQRALIEKRNAPARRPSLSGKWSPIAAECVDDE